MISKYTLNYSIDQVWNACLHVINETQNKENLVSIPEIKTIYFELSHIQTTAFITSFNISLNISLLEINGQTHICLLAELTNETRLKGYALREMARFMQRLVAKLKELG